jgi:signal transduction histidine kinase
VRGRLLALVGAISVLILLAVELPLAIYVRDFRQQQSEAEATRAAQAMAPVVATADEGALATALGQANARSDYPLTVYLPDGHVIGAPAQRSALVDRAATGQSLVGAAAGGREILIAVGGVGAPGGTDVAVIRAYVSGDRLDAGVYQAWMVLAGLAVGVVGVALLVADGLARGMIRPLRAAAATARTLAAGDVTARVVPGGPDEVRQVATGLNLLAGRIGDLLAREREALADLSHRLRTPLTALRIEVEAVPNDGERARLLAGLDELQRAADVLVMQARRPIESAMPARCDAAAVARERAAYWFALAEEEDRAMTPAVDPGVVPIAMSADELAACIDALLGNVFAHTPAGTSFAVSLEPARAGGARLVVSDTGPGIADVSSVRRGVSHAGSSGLGLSIVSRAAQDSGGYLHIGAVPGGGTRIEVEFGGPSPA